MPISGEPVWTGTDALSHRVVAQQEEILFEIDQQLLSCGILIEKIMSEYSSGQYEMSLNPEFDITAVDNAFIFKHAVKEMVAQREMLANFMTIPRFKFFGNSAHFNHSLWTSDLKQSAFFDSSGEKNLSEIAGFWLGGLCKHASAITALCSPSVNCYRRLHGHDVPHQANWGIENRHSSFRVKNQSASGCLIENRIASGNCNPYLVLAVVVASGLDGIINKMPCPREYDCEAPTLPYTLKEAIEALEKDEVIVEALGPDFIKWFVECKKQSDLKKLEKSDPKIEDCQMLEAERKMYSLNV